MPGPYAYGVYLACAQSHTHQTYMMLYSLKMCLGTVCLSYAVLTPLSIFLHTVPPFPSAAIPSAHELCARTSVSHLRPVTFFDGSG